MATSEFRNDVEGNRQNTEWHNLVMRHELAENCAQHLPRRRQFYIKGAVWQRDPTTNDHSIASDTSGMEAW